MEANEYSRMNSKWKHFLCWKRLSMFKGKNIRNNFRSYLHQVLFFIYFFLFWKTLLFRIPHTLELWKQGNICLHFIFALCPCWQWSNLDWANSNVSNFLSFNTTVSGRTEDGVKKVATLYKVYGKSLIQIPKGSWTYEEPQHPSAVPRLWGWGYWGYPPGTRWSAI